MRWWLVLMAALSVALFSAGCGGSYGCAAVVSPAVEVYVFDARTGAPAAEGATATVRDGDYVERLQVHVTSYPDPPNTQGVPLSFAGAYERPGVYTVRVEKPGYQPWEMTGVRVRKGDCGVNGARLEARLQPVE